MLWEVVEAEEAEQCVEERRCCEEEERQRVEEERWRAEEKVEEERRRVEAEQEEVKWLQDNLESFKKGLWALLAEEMAEIMAEPAEQAWKVWLGEGSSGQGPCWHCQS